MFIQRLLSHVIHTVLCSLLNGPVGHCDRAAVISSRWASLNVSFSVMSTMLLAGVVGPEVVLAESSFSFSEKL